MFVPTPLMSDASYNHFREVGLTSWKFLVPFVVMLAAAAYAIMRFKKKDPVSFCILYYFITISIVSNVVILIGTNYGERLLFMPSLGICLLLAILFSRLLKQDIVGNPLTDLKSFFITYSKPVLLTLGIVCLFAVQTIARNGDWKDNYTLYTTDVKKVPDSAHMLFYLANHITTEEFLEALPDSASRNKSREEAIGYLTRSVTIYPKYADGYQRRGFIYSQLHDSLRAEEDYKTALKYNPTHPIVYNNYGTLCFNQRRYDEAFKNFQQAVRYNPRYAHALNNLASAYGVFGQGETEMITRDPANAADHTERARNNFQAAISYFLKAIEADPDFGEPYRLVAVTYKNIGDQLNADKYERLYKQVMATSHAKN
jgi:tetratricopeptide (TPR) repeat protein